MPPSVNAHMAIIARQTHHQAGGEVCETAQLSDGRVLRVVGHEHYRSVTAELRGWLLWLGLSILLVGCGGAEFSPGVEQTADSSPAEASAPADAGSRGDGAASTDGGEMEATTACPPQSTPCMAPGYGRLQDGGCGCLPNDACSRVDHNDGIGQTWTDCAPVGTYDAAQATSACDAAGGKHCALNACGADAAASDVCSCGIASLGCVCWGFAGPGAGHVASSTLEPQCAGPGDWKWQ